MQSALSITNSTFNPTCAVNECMYVCKNSYGYDEISARILKASTPYVSSRLTYIFNKILSTGIFPDRLKFSEVKPLYKKGVKTEIYNYRSISLLT